jgi:probable HAF family extracellular repeat protein
MNMFKQLRKLWKPCATIFALTCFGNAFAQVSYQVTDLGVPKNDNYSMIMSVNDEGWSEIMAGNFLPGQGDSLSGVPLNGRALINVDGYYLDLGTLGGPNSWMNFGEINDLAQVVGDSETAVPDPNGEDICGFGTHLTCLPFLWQPFHMSALPTLGGNNGEASAINNRGQIVGMAENGAVDSSCQPGTMNNRVQLPVLWENGNANALPTVDHDPDGFAFWINDYGQAVGYSGNCSGPIHGIVWENRSASVLADLGTGGFAENINNLGQIVGTVGSADGTTQTGAIWQIVKGTGTTQLTTVLGLLPGDAAGIAFGNNNEGQVVGGEWNANFYWSHAFIWQNGVMTDLNTQFPASSNLFATFAAKINNRGQIGGMAIVCSGPHQGEMHAFLATPVKQGMGESIAEADPTCLQSNFPAADAVTRFLKKSETGSHLVL